MTHDHSEHHHGHGEPGHSHGAVDPSITTSERGIWALKWSFVALVATALVQVVVVVLSGSVALLSDTIRNGDALTAVPLWIAFALGRLRAQQALPVRLRQSRRSGRGDRGANHPISRRGRRVPSHRELIHPQPVGLLWAVAVAGTVGFLGSEAVAVFRIQVGRQIGSAALVADGYHAGSTAGLAWLSSLVLPGCGWATRWDLSSGF